MAEVAHLDEPRESCGGSCAGRGIREDVGAILVERAAWSKLSHHCQEGQLAEVEDCTGREAASKEIDKGARGARVEAKQTLEFKFVVMVESLDVRLPKNHGC